MRITDYEVFEVPPRWQLLCVETSDGTIGWGEPIVEGRAKTTCAAVEELLDNYLLGKDPLHIEDHWQQMYRRGFYRGGPILMSAISGIDQALWDIKGKQYGAPIYELLGGKVRDRVQLYQHIHGETVEELAAAAEAQVDAGFTVLKTTPTQKLRRIDTLAAVEHAQSRIAAVREVVNDNISVGLDFHGRVAKPMAKRLAVALEPYNPMFIEEPVLAEHNDVLADLAARTSIPIATGERMFSRWDFKRILEQNAVDIIQPDVSHAGGITELRKIATMAEAYDVALAPHSPLGPVALAASLQVDACTSNALIQEQVVLQDQYPTYLRDESVFEHENGYLDLLNDSGLGISIDKEAVQAAETDEAWTVPAWRHEDGSVAEW